MVLRIRKPRGLTTTQLIVALTVGVLGGAYIWQPLLIRYKKDNIGLQSKLNTAEVADKK